MKAQHAREERILLSLGMIVTGSTLLIWAILRSLI